MTVHQFMRKIKSAYRVRMGGEKIGTLFIVLGDGTEISSLREDNNKTTLESLGINRFSELKYFDKG